MGERYPNLVTIVLKIPPGEKKTAKPQETKLHCQSLYGALTGFMDFENELNNLILIK